MGVNPQLIREGVPFCPTLDEYKEMYEEYMETIYEDYYVEDYSPSDEVEGYRFPVPANPLNPPVRG